MEFDETSVKIDLEASVINHRKDKRYIKIGRNSWLRGQILICKHGGEVSIGEDCFIGENSRIWSAARIVIGNRVLISHNVNIHDNSSHSLDSKERHLEYLAIKNDNVLLDNLKIGEAEIIIEDDAWIGFNCTILKGVTVGRGAIIGANSIITRDVEPYSVMVGNPSKIIKYTT
ncbi:MAG TPA: acyltransferase [Puia sp.]|jgi:acetyltransferase-like isoleucine patch superfamily enzyme